MGQGLLQESYLVLVIYYTEATRILSGPYGNLDSHRLPVAAHASGTREDEWSTEVRLHLLLYIRGADRWMPLSSIIDCT